MDILIFLKSEILVEIDVFVLVVVVLDVCIGFSKSSQLYMEISTALLLFLFKYI